MNKGLFVHIIFFVISMLILSYVIQGDDTTIGVRVLNIIWLIFVQLFAALHNSINDNYEKKI